MYFLINKLSLLWYCGVKVRLTDKSPLILLGEFVKMVIKVVNDIKDFFVEPRSIMLKSAPFHPFF